MPQEFWFLWRLAFREGIRMQGTNIGYVHSIETFGTLDGPGIRYIVFLTGCPLRCKYCHNPDTWTGKGQAKLSSEIIADVMRYKGFYANGGVTISGGEPMYQHDFCLELLQGLRERSIHTALDTSGAIPLEKSKELIDAADMLLLDIKSADSKKFEVITGAPIDNTLATLDYCEATNKPIWIRHVVVPGLTDSREDIVALGKLLSRYRTIKKIELLPFHKLGEYKWENLGLEYTLASTPEPTHEQMLDVVETLADFGLVATFNS